MPEKRNLPLEADAEGQTNLGCRENADQLGLQNKSLSQNKSTEQKQGRRFTATPTTSSSSPLPPPLPSP